MKSNKRQFLAAIIRASSKLAIGVLAGLCTASGAIVYTFSGTTGSPAGAPAKQQSFRFTSPGFVNSLTSFPSSTLSLCSGCESLTFQPKVTNGVLGDSLTVTQSDASSTWNHVYQFPLGSFQSIGAHVTVSNWANAGTLTVEATPGLTIANAASFGASSVAPEEIVTIFSSDNLTDVSLPGGDAPTYAIGGVTATVRDGLGVDRPAQLLYVSPRQLNLVAPAGMAMGSGAISVTRSTGTVDTLPVTIARVAPGIFSMNADGQGVPAAQIVRVLADGSQMMEDVGSWNAASNKWEPRPIHIGSDKLYLVLYGTGLRNRSGYLQPSLVVPALRGDIVSDYAGPQPQYPGLDQVNSLLPAQLKNLGVVSFTFRVDSQHSNAVSLLFQE